MVKLDEFTRLIEERRLSRAEAYESVNAILSGYPGGTRENEIYDFLLATNRALAKRGIDDEEMIGFIDGVMDKAKRITPDVKEVIDIVGTGGDGGTLNVSTAAAFVVSAVGIPVAKHGNKSSSSKCGSADLMAQFRYYDAGYLFDLDNCAKMIEDIGFSFLYAPFFHPALARVAEVRRKIGTRTVFNLIGPFCNPVANLKGIVMGVYDPNLCEKFCRILKARGLERALVVHGDGMDELSPTGNNIIYELKMGEIRSYDLYLEDVGIKVSDKKSLLGKDAKTNAEDIRRIFSEGTKLSKHLVAKRQFIVLNAAGGIYVARGYSLKSCYQIAEMMIDSGEALKKLNDSVKYSLIGRDRFISPSN